MQLWQNHHTWRSGLARRNLVEGRQHIGGYKPGVLSITSVEAICVALQATRSRLASGKREAAQRVVGLGRVPPDTHVHRRLRDAPVGRRGTPRRRSSVKLLALLGVLL